MRLSLGIVSFVCLSLALLSGCAKPAYGTIEASLDVGGRSRSYLVHFPPGHDKARSWPLIVSLHGHGGQGVHQEELTSMSSLSDDEGVVVAYPNGIDRSWNDDRSVTSASDDGVDDVGFIRALIDKLVAEEGVDPRRVYVAGTSNGGVMSFRLACELSDKIAAFSPVIGLMPENAKDTCKPTRPMPMMMFVGTKDPLVPYEGGGVGYGGGRGDVMSADATREWWANANGCTSMVGPETIDPEKDETVAKKTTHTSCKNDADVIVFAFENAGHTWPSGPQYAPKVAIGRVSNDVDATKEMWRFFRQHALP